MKNINEYILKEELNDNIFWLLDKWFDVNEEGKQEFIELISLYKKDRNSLKTFIASMDLQKLKEFICFIYDDPSITFNDNSNYEYMIENIIKKIIANKSMSNKYSNQNIKKGFKISKDYNPNKKKYFPKDAKELKTIINEICEKNKGEENINFNSIDVSKITDFTRLFANNTDIQNIDIHTWETKQVENMSFMFSGCKNLKNVNNLTKFDTTNLKKTTAMFAGCEKLESIGNISTWKTTELVDASNMFMKCRNLDNIGNLAEWDTENLKQVNGMFFACRKLDCTFAEDWDVKNLNSYTLDKSMIFTYCKKKPSWAK